MVVLLVKILGIIMDVKSLPQSLPAPASLLNIPDILDVKTLFICSQTLLTVINGVMAVVALVFGQFYFAIFCAMNSGAFKFAGYLIEELTIESGFHVATSTFCKKVDVFSQEASDLGAALGCIKEFAQLKPDEHLSAKLDSSLKVLIAALSNKRGLSRLAEAHADRQLRTLESMISMLQDVLSSISSNSDLDNAVKAQARAELARIIELQRELHRPSVSAATGTGA